MARLAPPLSRSAAIPYKSLYSIRVRKRAIFRREDEGVYHGHDWLPRRRHTCLSHLSPFLRARRGGSAALVDQVAPEVSEVASGGHWSADGKGGFYRTFVVMGGEKGGIAEIYLQWVSFGDGKPVVVNSLPLKEINEQKLGNASITIGGEDDKENETTIFISSYDIEEDKDISLFVKATNPGTYSIEKAPPETATGRRRRLPRKGPGARQGRGPW